MSRDEHQYALIDGGQGRKLERFGPYVLDRPCGQAVWSPLHPSSWKGVDGFFTREPENVWKKKAGLPDSWVVPIAGIQFKISPTDFGHLGVFPEQAYFWRWIREHVQAEGRRRGKLNILNLFAYSGGSTLAAAQGGAQVCHLDASKGMVAWARENASLNGLEGAPIRWIVDDVMKFLARELKRGVRYDGIILDPPSFGRGNKGEIFKIEFHLTELLAACRAILSEKPSFILFSCHTPGFSPLTMQHLLNQMMGGYGGSVDAGEMLLEGEAAYAVPSGVFGRWVNG